MPKRIVIVSNFFPPVVVGGAEIVAHRQAKALAEKGYDVAVFAGGFARDAQEPGSLTIEMDDGFPVYRIALRSLSPESNFHCPGEERQFLSLLATHQAEIVHFHNVAGLGMNLVPAAKAFGAKVIVTLHDHWGFCFKNTMLRNDGRLCKDVEECSVCLPATQSARGETLPIRMRRDYVAWCLECADHLLSPSAYLAGAFAASNVVASPVEHLSNGVGTDRIAVAEKTLGDTVHFTCFSYLGEHKGILTLLDAAEELGRDTNLRGRWHLTIAGHGHLADRLAHDIASGRFAGAVTFAGRLAHPDALERLGVTHAVVLASHWPENEPVTLLEAIASGTAQIATRIGGNPDLVEDEASGLLVTPGQSGELAGAMRRFIDEPDLAARFGSYNAARRARFDEARTIARLIAIYDAPAVATNMPARGDIAVVCAGRAPSRAFAVKLQLMLHRFHLAEDGDRRIRFIWHEWAGAAVLKEAHLLWLWGDVGEAELPLVSQALRAGIPVLAPSACPLAGITEQGSGVGVYDTLLDAVGHIAALQDSAAGGWPLGRQGPSTARYLNAMAPRASFHLDARASA